jgi:predicted nucleic-acid-binding Zn-ribbon protein
MANDVVMKIFDDNVECPKCGLDASISSDFEGQKFKMSYCAVGVVGQPCEGLSFEHLHLSCAQCGYAWLMNTKERSESKEGRRGAHAESEDFSRRGRRGTHHIMQEE